MIKYFLTGISLFIPFFLIAQFNEQKIVPGDIDPGDFFGRYMAIQKNDLFIGAHQDDVNGYASGAMYIFSRLPGEEEFSEIKKVVPEDGDVEEFFGYSIDISGDWAVVGSHHDSDFGGSSGSAFLLRRTNDNWHINRKLLPSDPKAGDEFGKAVRISGDYIVIGCFLDDDKGTNTGSVYIFKNNEMQWNEIHESHPSDPVNYDHFGNFLSLDSGLLAVGVPEKLDKGAKSGCAYVFELQNDDEWVQTAKLVPDDLGPGDEFGQSIHAKGDLIVVGAYKQDASAIDGGAVYIYKKISGEWTQVQKLISPDNAEGDHFGNAVYCSEEILAVGAYFDDDSGSKSGSVYLYKWQGDSYTYKTKLISSDGGFGDAFGSAVAIDSNYLVVGAYADSDNGFFSGSAYVYEIGDLLQLSEKKTSSNVVFPTCFNLNFNIQLSDHNPMARIELYDSSGMIIKNWTQKVKTQNINVADLPPQTYVLRIIQAHSVESHFLFKIQP